LKCISGGLLVLKHGTGAKRVIAAAERGKDPLVTVKSAKRFIYCKQSGFEFVKPGGTAIKTFLKTHKKNISTDYCAISTHERLWNPVLWKIKTANIFYPRGGIRHLWHMPIDEKFDRFSGLFIPKLGVKG